MIRGDETRSNPDSPRRFDAPDPFRRDRRRFLRQAARAAALLAAAPLAGPLIAGKRSVAVSRADAATLAGRGRLPASLPPSTVGLRSQGGDFVFDPPGLHIQPGDEVHWLNVGDFHTVSAFHPGNAELLPGEVPLRIPEGAEPFHSGMLGLDAGNHFTHRFEVEGVYDYFCQPHYFFGMVGRLVVGRPRGEAAVGRPASDLVEAAREELPGVETITGPSGSAYAWSARLNGVLLLRAGLAGGAEAPAGDPAAVARAAAAAARAVAEAARADRGLLDLLDRTGARSAFLDALVRFADGAAGASYDELVSLADAAKAPLSRAVGSGR